MDVACLLGDELERSVLHLDADSLDELSPWEAPDFSLHDAFQDGGQMPVWQQPVKLDGIELGELRACARGNSMHDLRDLARGPQTELRLAAERNQQSLAAFGTPAQLGAWQGCERSAWCNAARHHTGSCNSNATVPGVSAYATLLEGSSEVDGSGTILDSGEGCRPGQTDSSAAGSGKHGSSATHHDDGEDSSHGEFNGFVTKAQACASEPGMLRNLSSGSLPGTARAHAVSTPNLLYKSDLDMDAGLPSGWMTCHMSSHPLSNHCPGATNVELLEAPDDGLSGAPALSCMQRQQQQSSPLYSSQRMADITSINSTWQAVQQNTGQLPSSFMINSEPSGWADTSDDNPSNGTWSSVADNSHINAGGVHRADSDAAGQRSLRATRSMPNFSSSVERSVDMSSPDFEAHAAGKAQGTMNRRVIIHRWPSGNAAPGGRKGRGSEDKARNAAGPYKLVSVDGSTANLSVTTACQSSAGSPTDLASPLSSAPSSSAFAAPQRPADGEPGQGSSGAQEGQAAGTTPRHGHNLRGRPPISHAAIHEGNLEGTWLQHQQGGGGPAPAPSTGVRTSRLPEVPPPQTHAGRKRGSGGPGSTCARPVPHPTGQCCSACGTTVTPVWRAGPQGPKTLCNACGVRYMKVARSKK